MSNGIDVLQAQVAQLKRSQRRLTLGYAGFGVLAVAALMMGATSQRSASFDVIDAQRINIKEPDGTLRLAISNRTLFPGVLIHNKEQPHPRPMAGMLFFNDEGTENGGLIYNGSLDKNGKPSSGMSLTFDRYQQDQQMQLLGVDEAGTHSAGLTFNDVADGLDRPFFSKRDEALHRNGVPAITERVFLGKSDARDAMLTLRDGQGKPRLELVVTPAGDAKVRFLDENGNATRELSADTR
ncbi:hypothetical protein ORK51_14030 [Stenotrophomonas rhizophila]|uniref:hypothetical protein n=1 Tax=Stenotrophomonas rhizophila TaxID=216778 RepID=UPI00224B29B2|nr:hypothetical protein [Stenotrophomonas rhizophila]MCX2921298.1 hypothetical protein [Stenotrophomonas rhizophila]